MGEKYMLNINVICVGKTKEKYLAEAIDEYSKRLSRYCNFNIVELSDEKLPEKNYESLLEAVKEKECKKIIDAIKPSSYVIALDLKGKQCTSEEFAKKIENLTLTNSSITFIIGGTLGLTDEVRNISNELISFSNMTFPHQLIRLFLSEQIFRAFKIINNETYHW